VVVTSTNILTLSESQINTDYWITQIFLRVYEERSLPCGRCAIDYDIFLICEICVISGISLPAPDYREGWRAIQTFFIKCYL
jgi:hypothetical protein